MFVSYFFSSMFFFLVFSEPRISLEFPSVYRIENCLCLQWVYRVCVIVVDFSIHWQTTHICSEWKRDRGRRAVERQPETCGWNKKKFAPKCKQQQQLPTQLQNSRYCIHLEHIHKLWDVQTTKVNIWNWRAAETERNDKTEKYTTEIFEWSAFEIENVKDI